MIFNIKILFRKQFRFFKVYKCINRINICQIKTVIWYFWNLIWAIKSLKFPLNIKSDSFVSLFVCCRCKINKLTKKNQTKNDAFSGVKITKDFFTKYISHNTLTFILMAFFVNFYILNFFITDKCCQKWFSILNK